MNLFQGNRTAPKRLSLLLALPIVLALAGARAADAQTRPHPGASEKPAFGSLSGTVTNDQHQPVANAHTLITSGVIVMAEPEATSGVRNPDALGQGIFGAGETPGKRVAADPSAGGLYTLDHLVPGVYNITVEAGSINQVHYRPKRIMGVVIRPSQQTALDITLHEGDTLEEAGEPTVAPSNAKFGWLEGTVVTADGQPINSARALLATGVTIMISNASGKLGGIKTDHMAGGFFSLENLHVGTYSFLIEAGEVNQTKYRPQQIQNIVIRPGIRTVLTIVVPQGVELQRTATPQVKQQPLKLPTTNSSATAL